MSESINVKQGQLYHFDPQSGHTAFVGPNPLKEFISLLKMHTGQSSFSMASKRPRHIQKLSLKQNLLLDLKNQNICMGQEKNLQQILCSKKYEFLNSLYQTIININDFPKDYNRQDQKVVSLVRTLLQETPYILLMAPLTYLNSDQQQFFSKHIKEFIQKTGKTLFLYNSEALTKTMGLTRIIKNEQNKFIFIEAPKKSISPTVDKLDNVDNNNSKYVVNEKSAA